MDLRCEQCSKPLVASGRGRPPARFCSRECKDLFRTAEQHARMLEKRAAQRCRQCGGAIPMDAGSRVQTCSRSCSVTWQNRNRQAIKRAAWLATSPVCQREQCEKPIPESRPRWSKYCSPECKKKEMDARWRASAPGYNRKFRYGVSQEEFDAKLAAQGGVCAICGTIKWMGMGNAPHTDHDHVTGAFRGVLCGNCNIGIGKLGEDPARLRAAAAYLEAALVTAPGA